MLISVIIPAYNVSFYIRKCLDSVINQTYTNLEIIIVDDGSTDSTGAICDEYMSLDNRITVVHQNNAGLSVARNVGLDIAKGDFIAFLDSDDWISPTMYEEMCILAIKTGADIVECKSVDCPYGKAPGIYEDSDSIISYNTENTFDALCDHKIRFEVWNKLWRRDVIGDIRFIKGQVSEDVHFDRLVFLNAKKYVTIDKTLHNYLTERPGNTYSSFKKARLAIFEEFWSMLDDLKQFGNQTLCKKVALLAITYVIGVYVEAVKTNQCNDILKQLYGYFTLFYEKCRGSEFDTFSIKVFKKFPKIFACQSIIKRKIKR